MSQAIPRDICRRREVNEHEVEHTAKHFERKKENIQHQSRILKVEVESLRHENILLDKQIKCTESLSLNVEREISDVKNKTEEGACSLEHIKWKECKTELLKEFENQIYESVINKQKLNKYEMTKDSTTESNSQIINCNLQNPVHYQEKQSATSSCLQTIKKKVEELKEIIKQSKQRMQQSTDSKLYLDIQVLENRNAALLLRYQRQLQETESRYRQTLSEFTTLQNLLQEKNFLLKDYKEK